MFNKKKTNFKARLVDNMLILSFFSRAEPKIMHVDLGKSHSSHLSIKEVKDKFAIFLTREKGEEDLHIYSFSTKAKALKAFKEIANAMLTSKGVGHGCRTLEWVKNVVKLVLVLVVFYLLATVFLFPTPLSDDMSMMTPPSAIEEGTSVPLEDVLK